MANSVSQYNSDPARLRFIDAAHLEYDISVGPDPANWTVMALNGSAASNPMSFTVAAGVDITPPEAPVTPSTEFVGKFVYNLFYVDWLNPEDASGISKIWYKLGSAPTSATDGIGLDLPLFKPLPMVSDGPEILYIWLEDTAGNKDANNYSSVLLEPPDERDENQFPEIESNDQLTDATAVSLTQDPSGSGYFVGRGIGSIQPATDEDWWSFTALAGDVVSVSVDTPEADGVRPYVTLLNAGGSSLTSDWANGQDYDAYISHYVIPSSGTYYVQAEGRYQSSGIWHSSVGSYELRLDLARGGTQLESDANYSNDSIGGANELTLEHGAPGHLTATVAGTIMSPEASDTDEDLYLLGTLSAGNVVQLRTTLPSTSSLVPKLTLLNSSGVPVADTDADDGHFQGTIPADGPYYAKIESVYWTYSDHKYQVTPSSMRWTDAEAYAQSVGGHLVTVNDQAEQDWLTATFGGFSPWIGFTDQAVEGTWVWSSGQPVTYTNWATSEPSSGTTFDWAYLSSGEWYDANSGTSHWGVIELESGGSGTKGPGPWAQYLLNVDVADLIAPTVTAVSPLPANGSSTDKVVDKLTVSFSEDLDPAPVNAMDRPVWNYGGHAYLLTDSNLTWANAEAYAQSLGGHLVTVNDQAEQAWIKRTLGSQSVWIGLTDQAVEGTWVWSSGQTVTYTNWATSEPSSGTTFDWAYQSGSSGTWFDASSGTTQRGLIELDGPDGDSDGLPNTVDPYPVDAQNTFDLREAGNDGVFDTSDDVHYRLTADPTYSSGLSAGLLIQGGPLGNGHYRFTANRTLLDRSGNALDGDGDGSGGDAYEHMFDVTFPAGFTFEGTSNDSLAYATSLPLTQDPSGSGYFVGRGIGSIQPATDEDWWSFTALAGDVVSVSVDTPDSSLNPYLFLRNAGGSSLVSDDDGGPGADSFNSHYVISSSGVYYVQVTNANSASYPPGSYELRVDLARGGTQLESDEHYSNDSTSGANELTLEHGAPGHLTATVAGTIMSPEGSNADEDWYLLGTLSAGNVVQLRTTLPSASSLVPKLTLLNSSGVPVADTDADDGDFQGTIPADGPYYAKVESAHWMYNGHKYLVTPSSMTWTAAEAYAQSLGGHLATVNNQAEQDWLVANLGGFFPWIGFTDQAVEGTWVWSSGQAGTYTNWATSEPSSGTTFDWAYLSSGEWYDANSGTSHWGVIELESGGSGTKGPGPWAQYLLNVEVADLTAPTVTAVSPLPANGGSTDKVVDKLTVSFSEELDAAPVNAMDRTVWNYGGHAYLLTDSNLTWANAEAYAQSLGGHLVTINNQAEQNWIKRTLSSQSVWIGFTDQAVEGTWVWSSGQTVTYTNWASGQPGSNDWALMSGSSGAWSATSGIARGLIELDGPDSDGDGLPNAVDPYSVDAQNNFDLREVGSDGVFNTSDDVLYRLTADPIYSSGLSVGLLIQGGPLGNGHYRFTANRTLLDRSGNALDGDGDGSGGDAYEHIFDVTFPAGFTFEGTSNDTRAYATSLPLTQDPAGSGYFVGRGIGSIQPATDEDWWSFTALAGDVVSVSVDTPDSSLIPGVWLYNAAGNSLASNYYDPGFTSGAGPGNDPFISHYVIPSSGAYYVKVNTYRSDATPGSYQLRLDLTRGGTQLESDEHYSNDSTSGANELYLTNSGEHRYGTIAGTVMSPSSGNVDEDYFNLGVVQAGETIFLSCQLPLSSTLQPVIEIRDSTNHVVAIAPNISIEVDRVDITVPGVYYAVVVALGGEGSTGQYLLDVAFSPTGSLGLADLAVAEVAIPSSAAIGGVAHLSWKAANYGTGGISAVTWSDRVVLSSNDTYGDSDDIELISSGHRGPLDVNQVYPGQANVVVPQVSPGNYWVFVQIDASNVVDENLFENNNVRRSDAQINVLNIVPPTVDLTNPTTALPENTSMTSRIKVADIVITDDALGTNNFSLAGADAALFEIQGVVLYLKAGTLLDFETKAVLNVTVQVDDPTVGTTPDDTADLAITITDVNELPTVALQNTMTALAENTSTASRIKVADIVVTDDVLGTNNLSLAGADAVLFEILSGALYLKAGTTLDFETNPVQDVTVQVDDPSVGVSPDDTADLAITITDVNEPPTVALQSTTTTLAENTSTASRIKVADIVVNDDAPGTNNVSLSGADAALFEIVSSALFLRAGTVLDFETNPVLDVTVRVDDPTVGTTPDDTGDLAISVTDMNEVPVINNQTLSASNENIANGTPVGTVAASDPDAGQTLAYSIIAGNTNGAFAINSTTGQITVVNSAALDFETTPSFSLTARVTDNGSPSVFSTATVTINLADVNERPTVVLQNSTASLPENTSTASRVKVADIVVNDDALGTNNLSLAGADAALFEIQGGVLYLKAGTLLDFETKAVLNVTVQVDDPAQGSNPDDTVLLAILVTDINDAPFVNDKILPDLEENSVNGTLVGGVVADDVDSGQTLIYQITSGNTGGAFAIDSATGEIRVANSAALDFETTPSFTLTVTVTDNGSPSLSDVATIRIALVDVNAPTVRTEMTLVRAPTSIDPVTGEVASLLQSEAWIHEWNSFWVEVWASTVDSDNIGIVTASVTLTYNTNYFTAMTIVPGPAFDNANRTGTIDDVVGEIRSLGGTSSRTDAGDDKHVLLARVLFESKSNDTGVPIDVGEAEYILPMTDPWLGLVDDGSAGFTLDLSEPVTNTEFGDPPDTELWPMPFDLNDDGRIGFGDLSILASAFLKKVGDIPVTFKADFDHSGRVGFGDFSLLVSNFLKHRSSGSSIAFPSNLPGNWRPASILAELSAPPLSVGDLTSIVQKAVKRPNSPADPTARATLATLTVEVADLPGKRLGQSLANIIQIDVDAAGFGWFVNTTPGNDLEVVRRGGTDALMSSLASPTVRRADLLSVVMHELRHLIGYEHNDDYDIIYAALLGEMRRWLGDGIGDEHVLTNEVVDAVFTSWDDLL